MQERHRASRPILNVALPGNHTLQVHSNITLKCEILFIDDTSPPEISWLRHFSNAWTNDNSKFGREGFDKEGNSRGYRLVDEYGNPMFAELQTCAINGNCGSGKVLGRPLEYSLKNINMSDEGWYSCRATNNYGVTLSSGYISVKASILPGPSKFSKANPPSVSVIAISTVFATAFFFIAAIVCVGFVFRKKRRRRKLALQNAKLVTPITKSVKIYTTIPSATKSCLPIPLEPPTVKIEKVAPQLARHTHRHTQGICNGGNCGMCSYGEYAFTSDPKWELDRFKLKIGDILGEGEFGRVVSAEYTGNLFLGSCSRHTKSESLRNTTVVAVKMLKEGHTDADVIDLVKEMTIMKQMGQDQTNIIKLLGACTQPVGYPLLVVVELAKYGNLKEYLISNKPSTLLTQVTTPVKEFSRGSDSTGIYETPVTIKSTSLKYDRNETDISLDVKELLNMTWQVSKGMTYLSQRKFVHRDLAARNILVCDKKVYKIADFGMARPVHNADYYRRKSNGKVPLKWMAPESIFQCVHTSQSDVWSYGILLWEIFSYGDNPYKGLRVDVLMEFLKQRIPLIENTKDYVMEQPRSMPTEIYRLMGHCWNFDAALRPTWTKIQEVTRNYYEAAQPNEYLIMANTGAPLLQSRPNQLSINNRVSFPYSHPSLSSTETNMLCARQRLSSNFQHNRNISSDQFIENARNMVFRDDIPLLKCSTGYYSLNFYFQLTSNDFTQILITIGVGSH